MRAGIKGLDGRLEVKGAQFRAIGLLLGVHAFLRPFHVFVQLLCIPPMCMRCLRPSLTRNERATFSVHGLSFVSNPQRGGGGEYPLSCYR